MSQTTTSANSAPTTQVTSTLRTRRRSDGLLVRSLGSTAPAPFSAVPAELMQMDVHDEPSWRWRCGSGDAQHRRYHLDDSARSLIELAFGDHAASLRRRHALGHIGAALARLHAMPGPASSPPPALARLQGFIGQSDPGLGGSLDDSVTARREMFIRSLKPGVAERLRADCRAATHPTDGVLSHGWAGLDKWYIVPSGGIGLLGEDLGWAAPEHDLGSVFAQIVEYHSFVPGSVSAADVRLDRESLLTGYGRTVDADHFDREVRLAISRHIADYSEHTNGPDSELMRYASLISGLYENPAGSRGVR